MDKDEFLELLNKYNKGQATKEEQQLIISYYNLFHSNTEITDLLGSKTVDDLNKDIFTSIQSEVFEREELPRRGKAIRIRRLISAAAIFLLLCTAAIFYFKPAEKTKPALISNISKPKENRLLRLPDGTTVILDPGSKLNYPSSFDGYSSREVYLDG